MNITASSGTEFHLETWIQISTWLQAKNIPQTDYSQWPIIHPNDRLFRIKVNLLETKLYFLPIHCNGESQNLKFVDVTVPPDRDYRQIYVGMLMKAPWNLFSWRQKVYNFFIFCHNWMQFASLVTHFKAMKPDHFQNKRFSRSSTRADFIFGRWNHRKWGASGKKTMAPQRRLGCRKCHPPSKDHLKNIGGITFCPCPWIGDGG